jgi:hypothetical protein
VITVKFIKQRIIVQLQLYGVIIIGVNPLQFREEKLQGLILIGLSLVSFRSVQKNYYTGKFGTLKCKDDTNGRQ